MSYKDLRNSEQTEIMFNFPDGKIEVFPHMNAELLSVVVNISADDLQTVHL